MQMLAAVEMRFLQLKARKYISEQDLRGKEIVISRYALRRTRPKKSL